MNNQSYIWYASYGSNLLKDRFLCYIKGGKPKGSSRTNIGCRDNSLPKNDMQITIPFQLYFAKKAKNWLNQGVAFIGHDKVDKNPTLGRMYLISEQQFIDVISQENGNKEMPFIDFKEVQNKSSLVIFNNSWYGNIVYIGDHDSSPIFTFTSPLNIESEPLVAPSNEYLKVIISGLKEIYSYTNQEIAQYLITKPGIKNHFLEDQLIKLALS